MSLNNGQQMQLPDMNPYKNEIFARVAQMAQHFGQKNQVRATALQRLSNNGGSNNDMQQVVNWTADYLLFGLVNGTYNVQGIPNYVDTAIDFVLKAHCGLLLLNDPRLVSTVQQQDAQNSANFYNQLLSDLNSFYQAIGQPQGQQNVFGGQQNPFQQQQPPFVQQNHNQFANNQPRSAPSNQVVSRGQSAGLGSHHGTLNQSGTESQSSNRTASGGRRSQSERGGYSQQPVVEEVRKPPVSLSWKASPEQPYPPLINPRKEVLQLAYSDSKTLIMKVQPLGEDKMDRNQHRLTSTATGKIAEVGQNAEQRTAAANGAIRRIAAASNVEKAVATDKRAAVLGELSKNYIPEIVSAVSIDDLIFMTRLTAAARFGATPKNTAIRMDGDLAKRFVFNEYNEDRATVYVGGQLNQAAAAGTYGALKNALQNINAYQNTSLKELANQLDVYLASELNTYVMSNLGVDSLSIDSFYDDLEPLATILGNQAGPVYVEALKDRQEKFVRTAVGSFHLDNDFILAEGDPTEGLVAQDDVETNRPVILTLNKLCSVTLISLYDKELDLGLFEGNTSAIQSASHPVLLEFARSVVDDNNRTNERNFAHHYLVTADDVIYELQKGSLGNENFLIARVN